MRAFLGSIVALSSLPVAVSAAEPALSLEGRQLVVAGDERTTLELPCPPVAVVRDGARALVACGADGLVEVSLDAAGRPSIVGRRDLGAPVVGFVHDDGRVWAKVARLELRSLGAGDAAATAPAMPATPAAAPPPSEPASAPVGELVERGRDDLTIGLGTAAGLSEGAHVEFFVVEQVDLGRGETKAQDRTIAIGETKAVGREHARVVLGTNEEVPDGVKARRTDRPLTAGFMAPRRADDVWEYGFTARPFLSVGSGLGGGVVADGFVGYRDEFMHYEARVQPAGLAFGFGDGVAAAGASATAAFDTRLFELGLGLGATTLNFVERSCGASGFDACPEQGASATFVQQVRLGALDGLHVMGSNGFAFSQDRVTSVGGTRRVLGLRYHGTYGEVQVPIGEGYWLQGRGGGGAAGAAFGDLALRARFHGTGEKGSLFLTASVGGVGVFKEKTVACPAGSGAQGTCVEETFYGGPAVGFGMEWRQ